MLRVFGVLCRHIFKVITLKVEPELSTLEILKQNLSRPNKINGDFIAVFKCLNLHRNCDTNSSRV